MTEGTENPPRPGPAAGNNSGGEPSDSTRSLYERITKHDLGCELLIHRQGEVALSIDMRKTIDGRNADIDPMTTLKSAGMAPQESDAQESRRSGG